jgi:chorismate mutase/prephenate dehydratase
MAGKTVPSASTSKAAEIAAAQPNAACIGSELIGGLHGLTKLRDRIEDQADNVTRFLVIGRAPAPATGKDKTAIVFSASDKPGSLVEVLDVLRKGGINMTYIESRPSRKRNWEYVFFVDFEGHQADPAVAQALAAARPHCGDLRVLGSFPKAQEVL